MSFLLCYHAHTRTHIRLLQTQSTAHRLANISAFTDSMLHPNTADVSVNNRNDLILLLLAAWSKPASSSHHPPRHRHKHGSCQCLAGTSGLSLQYPALRPLVSGPCSYGLSDNSDTSASGVVLSCTSMPANMWHQFILLVKQGDICSFINIRDRPSSNTE